MDKRYGDSQNNQVYYTFSTFFICYLSLKIFPERFIKYFRYCYTKYLRNNVSFIKLINLFWYVYKKLKPFKHFSSYNTRKLPLWLFCTNYHSSLLICLTALELSIKYDFLWWKLWQGVRKFKNMQYNISTSSYYPFRLNI